MKLPDKETNGSKRRKRVISYVLLSLIGFILVPGVIIAVLPAVRKMQEKAKLIQSGNNLKLIWKAMKGYHDIHGRLPPAAAHGKDGRPLYSWRVLLLPFLGEEDLYFQFKLDEAWDSPTNKPLLAKMPLVYAHPTHGKPKEPYGTYYQVFVGDGAVFEAGPDSNSMTLKQIEAGIGTASTMLVVEAANSVPWTKPEGLPYAEDKPLPQLGGLYTEGNSQYIFLMADGSIHSVYWGRPEEAIRINIVWNRHMPEW